MGGTVGDLMRTMSAAEFDLWRLRFKSKGLPADRLEWGIAKAGSAVCNSNGSRVRPADLIPQFLPGSEIAKAEEFSNWLSGLPGVKVRRFEKSEHDERDD